MTPSEGHNLGKIHERLNRHLSQFHCLLIEHKDGCVYILKEHWKYLRPFRDAERVKVGKGQISENQFEYLTKEFKPTRKR